MSSCTFFGHRDTPQGVLPILTETLKNLIINKQADRFYIGNEGNFDKMAQQAVAKLKKDFPHIKYSVVLAYLPKIEIENSIFPEGLELVPKRFAISYRNKWLIEKSDYIVTYVRQNYGGAAKFKTIAQKAGKVLIEL